MFNGILSGRPKDRRGHYFNAARRHGNKSRINDIKTIDFVVFDERRRRKLNENSFFMKLDPSYRAAVPFLTGKGKVKA